MKYRNAIIVLGFVVILIQFLGFPTSWKSALYPLAGLGVIALSYLAGKAPAAHRSSEPRGEGQSIA